ncbi:MAG: sigma-54 dependent transcriptional regulator [bacterium]|nr:sigma-54 dependent transcriptional regulator [bacterium]
MRILIASDNSSVPDYRDWLATDLKAAVEICRDTGDLLRKLRGNPCDCLIFECHRNSWQDVELLGIVRERFPETPVVFVCNSFEEDAVGIMRMGVSDYLVPPLNRQQLVGSIRKLGQAGTGRNIPKETVRHIDSAGEQAPVPEEIVFGGSAKMEALKSVMDKILDADLPVLITGESGTGKEMIAQYIYNRSSRKGPIVKVNCAAIPSELLESELFGYEKGAFTGAYRRKPGKFEVADGGALFLDEISELSYPLQSKLLHVLQDGTFSTLGSTGEVSVDVRIIAATNQDLEECVRNGTFRDDLYFRLNVVHFHIPPLRERLDQLGSLVEYFLDKFSRQYNTRPVRLSPEVQSFLYTYPWPGNIRELENAIRRATVLGGDNLLGHVNGERVKNYGFPGNAVFDSSQRELMGSRADIDVKAGPDQAPAMTPERIDLKKGIDLKRIAKEAALAAEKEAISRVLQQTRWNRKKTAQILQVSYKTLLTKIKRTGLDEG